MKKAQPNFIVGICGSAAALDAYKVLLDAMPDDTGMVFVIISHMNSAAHCALANTLSKPMKMSVIVAAEAMLILANLEYVIPPDSDLTIQNYRFKVFRHALAGTKR